MKKIRNILRSKRGETITETLIGVLIVGMASAILVTGITTSLNINKKTKDLSASNKFTYSKDGCTETDKGMTIKTSSGYTYTLEVKEYKDSNDYVWFEPK